MADKKPSRLGTGLSALFGEEKNLLEENEPQTLPIARVEPRRDQPRQDFDSEALRELALVENLQRQDLNPMEEARGYRSLMQDYGLTQEEVAGRVQRSRPAVANALRLLGLSAPVAKMVSDGGLSAGHARALLPLKDPALQEKTAREVISRGLSVRQTEALAAALLRTGPETPESTAPAVDYVREAERKLTDALGRGVRFTGGQKKGRISLEFYSPDDREALMEALMKMDKPWKSGK